MLRQHAGARNLLAGPFTLDEAREAGITRGQLQSRRWRRVGYGTYASAALPESPLLAIQAVRPRLPPGGAFSGLTSAWLDGLDVVPCDPIEATIPSGTVSARAGARIRRSSLGPGEVVIRRGLPATSMLRTLADLAAHLPVVEAVVVADMALHAQRVTLDALRASAEARAGRKGVARLRRVIELAEPKAESPMETQFRLLLVLAGLPRPEAQVDLHDAQGRFIARADLYYREHRLVLEYDGVNHRDRLVEDNRRQNRLIEAGYRPMHFSRPDVLGMPELVVAQVEAVVAGRRRRRSVCR